MSLLIFHSPMYLNVENFNVVFMVGLQETLLPGIFGLIKGCTPPELTFLKASLEPHIRDSFGRLMTKFDTSYKFGGRM